METSIALIGILASFILICLSGVSQKCNQYNTSPEHNKLTIKNSITGLIFVITISFTALAVLLLTSINQ